VRIFLSRLNAAIKLFLLSVGQFKAAVVLSNAIPNLFDESDSFDADSPALFLNSSRQRLSTQGIANIIAQFRKDAGIERNITPPMLRHTVATLLLRNGVDIRVVQEFLGHASIATTQRYTHVAKEHLIGVLRKSHPSLGLRMKALWRLSISWTPP